MKALKKALVAVLGAVLGCCFFVGCLSTKLSVTYMVDGETYRVQEYEMDTQISLPTAPTKEGYTFIGWYTDEALTVPYAEGAITAGLTLYAKFSVSSVYIAVNTAGGEKIDPIEVVPGADYTIPEAVKEGHTFLGYTYIDENGDEQEFPLSGKYPSTASIKVTAKYEINKYTVTFVGAETSEQEVAYGSVAVAPNTDKAGYTFEGWYTSETEQTEETKFDLATAIKEEVTLYAKYSPKTFTITVNGAQAGYANPSVVYGETYTLVAPELENFEFVKFTMNGKDFPATGTYTWTEDIAVDAVWDGEGKFVWFYDGATELSDLRIVTEYDADITAIRLPNVPAKTGYSTDNKWYTDADCTQEFVAEGTVTDNISLYAKYTANEYTVTFKVWDKATKAMKDVAVSVTYGQTIANVPARAERDAYDFKGYFLGEEPFDVNKAYTYTKNITVEEKWELREDASLFDYNQAGNYFTERDNYDADWTYVYLVGETYTFAETVSMSMVTAGGEAYATVAGNTLTANAAGTFVVQVNNNGNVYNRTIKTVEYIRNMSLAGTTYDTAWGLNAEGTDYKRNATDVWDRKVALSAGEAMKVGKTNFIPELNYNGKVAAFDGNFTATVTENGVEVTDYTIVNGAINFGDSLVGKTLTITVMPRYAVNSTHKAVYTVVVNNAYNVYNDADMKAAFANLSVKEVNVLRNITPILPPELTNTYVDEWGKTQVSAKAYEHMIDPTTGEYYGTRFSTGVYLRRTGNMKINGNYFTVDGSKLPLTDARDGDIDLHKPGSGYGILDTRFSIFLFGRRHWGDRSVHQIDNLNIQGNGDMDAAASYKYDGVDVVKYSGATINVHIAGGTLTMNNVTSRFGSFGLYGYTHANFADACGVVIKATDCKIEKSWANNVYLQGFTDVTLDSCFIGVANGAAIHSDTRGSQVAMDAELKLVGDTDIQNWVNGNEAWFKAQNLGSAITSIKSLVDPNLRTATGMLGQTKTVIKYVDSTEYINFAILVRQTGDNSDWTTDEKGTNRFKDMDPAFINGYLMGTYSSCASALDALAPGFSYMDIEYVGFMNGAGYGMDTMGKYLQQHISDKLVKARANMGGLIEVYVEMVNA